MSLKFIVHTLMKIDINKTMQGIHKRMVRFKKLTKKLFLTLHGHNVHRQQRQLSKFLMGYQQFASHAYCRASFQDGVAAGKGFMCAPFWDIRICDYSAVHGLEKNGASLLNRERNSRCTV